MKKRIIAILTIIFMLLSILPIIPASAANDDGIIFCSIDGQEVGRAARRDQSLYGEKFWLYFPEEAYIDKIVVKASVNYSEPYLMISNVYDGTFSPNMVFIDSDTVRGVWSGEKDSDGMQTFSMLVRQTIPKGLYYFHVSAYSYVTNSDGDLAVTVYGEAPGMKEMTEDAYKKLLDEKPSANDWKLDLPEVKFSNNAILFESNPTIGWHPENSWTDELEFIFYVDKEITINDLYFETEFTGQNLWGDSYDWDDDGEPDNLVSIPKNLRIEICKITDVSDATGKFIFQSLNTYKSSIYKCSSDDMFYYNSFDQLTGASGLNLTLKRGVYYAHITPQSETSVLLGGEPDEEVYYIGDYGVVATGSTKGDVLIFSPDVFIGLVPLIKGVNSGKSVEQINKEYDAAIKKAIEEQRKADEARKKAEEAAKKAAAEKAAKEYAAMPITLKVNGVVVKTDSPPVIQSGRTLAPVRAIVEALGYIVAWDSSTQVVDIYDPDTHDLRITLKIGSNKAKVSTGIYGVMDERILDVPAKLINGRTMVPVRFIAETLGCTVGWDEKTKTVSITSAKG